MAVESRCRATSYPLAIMLLAVFLLGGIAHAVDFEGFGGFGAAANSRQDNVPAQKRQGSGGVLSPINSIISGLDGQTSSPFLPFGTTTMPSVTPTAIISSSPTSSSSSSSTVSPTSTSSSTRSPTSTADTTSSSSKKSSSTTSSSSVKPVTHTSPLVSTFTQNIVTVFTTVSGSNTIVQTRTSQHLVPSTTGFATSISSPTLSSDSSSGSSGGLSSSSKAIIGGVVGGVGGALLLAGIAFVLWRLYGRNRDSREGERLVSDYPYTDMRATPSGGHSRIASNYASSPGGMDRGANHANVNPAANF